MNGLLGSQELMNSEGVSSKTGRDDESPFASPSPVLFSFGSVDYNC